MILLHLPQVCLQPYSPLSSDFKAELLTTLCEETGGIYKSELQLAMTETSIKYELFAESTELGSSMVATDTEVTDLRTDGHGGRTLNLH